MPSKYNVQLDLSKSLGTQAKSPANAQIFTCQ